MTEFAALRSKTCSCLTDDKDENRKAKDKKKCHKIKFKDNKSCLEANQLEKEGNHLEKIYLIQIV